MSLRTLAALMTARTLRTRVLVAASTSLALVAGSCTRGGEGPLAGASVPICRYPRMRLTRSPTASGVSPISPGHGGVASLPHQFRSMLLGLVDAIALQAPTRVHAVTGGLVALITATKVEATATAVAIVAALFLGAGGGDWVRSWFIKPRLRAFNQDEATRLSADSG